LNSRVTRSLINQDKIIGLIEKQNRKMLAEKLEVDKDKMTSKLFENHITLNLPLRTLNDVVELEKLLNEKQYYKLLVSRTVDYVNRFITTLLFNHIFIYSYFRQLIIFF